MNRKNVVLTTISISFILFFVISWAQKTKAETNATNSTSLAWEDAQALTVGGLGSIRPAVAVSPDGKTVFVAHMQKTSSTAPEEADPFYSRSNDYGKNWLNPLPIRVDTSEDSRFIDVTIDANNNGHAVWTENNNELWYRPESAWGFGAGPDDFIYTATLIIDSPKIIASGSNTLNLVWSNTDLGDTDIFFARSTNGGNNWPTNSTNISNSGGESIIPDIAIDAAGIIHVVWQQQDGLDTVIQYSRSTNGGSTWSTPINISDAVTVGTEIFNQPNIYIQGSKIHVAFENRLSTLDQNAYYATCDSANCTNLNNWSGAKITTQNYSVRNTDPAFLKPQIVAGGNCPLIMFTSIIGDPTLSTERIRISSGCEGWSNNPVVPSVQAVMGADTRAISPNVASSNSWFIYLAFERKEGTGANDLSQIYVTRNIPGLYLPVIMK